MPLFISVLTPVLDTAIQVSVYITPCGVPDGGAIKALYSFLPDASQSATAITQLAPELQLRAKFEAISGFPYDLAITFTDTAF